LFSQTFPKCFTVSEGVLYEQATSALRTDESGSFSSLPTPQARDWKGSERKSGRIKPNSEKEYYEGELSLPEAVSLLSTPNARDWKDYPGKNYNAGSLPREVKDLLPTPRAEERDQYNSKDDYVALSLLVKNLPAWGKYEPAIHRWEAILSRQAPVPTTLSPRGNHRLNPEFASWMMGLPEGWVTEVPELSRKEQLHAIGNGVVPQQAAHAIRLLLSA
jgi:DNA (cytosine-5)-methyltransferase 1